MDELPTFADVRAEPHEALNLGQLFRNFSLLASCQVLAYALAFVSMTYIARMLGPEGFGVLGFAAAIVVYFALVVNFGLPLVGAREVARQAGSAPLYVGRIVPLRLVLAGLSFALLLPLALIVRLPPQGREVILIYGIGLFFNALVLDWLFQGLEKMHYIVVVRLGSLILNLALVFVIVRGPEDVVGAASLGVVSGTGGAGGPMLGMGALAAVALLAIFLRWQGWASLRPRSLPWRGLLAAGLPLGFSLAMIQVYYSMDFVILGFVRAEADVGYYNAAYRLIVVLLGTTSMYFYALYPVLSRFYATSLANFQNMLQVSARVMTTVAVPLAVGATFVGGPLVNLLFGGQYAESAVAFRILVWAVAIVMVSNVYGHGVMVSQPGRYARAVSAGAAVNLALNLGLIPLFGIVGASIATVAAEAVVFVVMYRFLAGVARVPLLVNLPRPLAATAAMGVTLVLVPEMHVLGTMAVGAAVFGCVFGAIALFPPTAAARGGKNMRPRSG